MSYKPPMGDPLLLKKRIITNPKYDSVQPTVECGISGSLARLIREAEPTLKQGPNEKFRRIRASAVANTLEEAHLDMRMREYALQDEVYAIDTKQPYSASPQRSIPQPPPLRGGQSTPSIAGEDFEIPKGPKRELLILDVRDREDYERCHILNALHYPPTKLSHATNPYTAEILAFKNKDNKLIVLYDLEEETVVGRHVANIFFEKGCDNVVIMAGGLKAFVQDFSHLILGESPVPIVPKDPRIASRGGTSVAGQSVAEGSKAHSAHSSHKPKSLSTSLARGQSSSWR